MSSPDYYQPNVPYGPSLLREFRFEPGSPVTDNFQVPTGKTAVISAIKLKFFGQPFRHVIDESHSTSGGQVTLAGAGGKDHPNILLVDSAYTSADGIYSEYNPSNPGTNYYHHGQGAGDEGHDTSAYGKFEIDTGVVYLKDSGGSAPPDATTVYVDYVYFDWTLTVDVPSIGWDWVLNDAYKYWEAVYADTLTVEGVLIQALFGGGISDMEMRGGLFGPLAGRIFVPLASNLTLTAGNTISFTFDAITGWDARAKIDIAIIGWMYDTP